MSLSVRPTNIGFIVTVLTLTTACTANAANSVPSSSSATGAESEVASSIASTRRICLDVSGPGAAGPLTVELAASPRCGETIPVSLRVTNSSASTCKGSIRGELTNGQDITFASTTGEGGEFGTWAPTPDSEIADGVIDYPPGDRVWPLVLPQLSPGQFGFTLPPISCGPDHLQITVNFVIASE